MPQEPEWVLSTDIKMETNASLSIWNHGEGSKCHMSVVRQPCVRVLEHRKWAHGRKALVSMRLSFKNRQFSGWELRGLREVKCLTSALGFLVLKLWTADT